MFKFLVKFLKIMVIACIIGVLLRVIDIIFLKQEATNIEISNITNEIQDEERTEIASNIIAIEEQKNEEIIEKESEKKQDTAKAKQEEHKEDKKTETKVEIKKEEKQNISNNQPLPKTNKQEVTETKKETQVQDNYTEVKVDVIEKKKCNGNNHGRGIGNSNKWFETKEDAIATYKAEIKKWGEKWSNDEISDDIYYKNCPIGYEIWDCPFCSKWTINYHYDN